VINERNTPQIPTSSYGTEKMICELLLNDYSRRGFIDGRAVRLPTVTVRAGKPTQAASSFCSGIIREPLKGEKSVLPVRRETDIWLCSPSTVVKNLIHAKDVPAEAFGDSRSVNLPGIKVSVQEMLDVLEEVGGGAARALVEEEYDPDVDAIVAGWSPNFDISWAKKLGFVEDLPFLETVRRYAAEHVK
jgi:nucleoside-diphosphate-sugar epimerase